MYISNVPSEFGRVTARTRFGKGTLPNSDGTFDIYINQNLPEEWQEAALRHELNHIRMDHFYNEDPVAANEAEAG